MTGASLAGLARLERHASLASTSDRLRELALEGAPFFTGVVADEQTRGRGRAGRTWVSAPGSGLWISVLLPPPPGGPPGVASIVVGVAAARAIERVTGVEVGLKWPNDLLVPDSPARRRPAKVGGILCEAVRVGDGAAVVAGVGVNLRRPRGLPPTRHADDPMARAAFLEESAGRPLDSDALAAALVAELRERADPPPDRLDDALGAEWDRRDLLRGRRVRTDMAPPGVAVGLGPDGALRVADGSGTVHTVKAGSVRLEGEGPPALHAPGDAP